MNDSTPIVKMPISEFRSLGYLQELNRQFLHPLGLALEVVIDNETGEETLGGVWDYRSDPEGIIYSPTTVFSEEAHEKAVRIAKERKSRVEARAAITVCSSDGIQEFRTDRDKFIMWNPDQDYKMLHLTLVGNFHHRALCGAPTCGQVPDGREYPKETCPECQNANVGVVS